MGYFIQTIGGVYANLPGKRLSGLMFIYLAFARDFFFFFFLNVSPNYLVSLIKKSSPNSESSWIYLLWLILVSHPLSVFSSENYMQTLTCLCLAIIICKYLLCPFFPACLRHHLTFSFRHLVTFFTFSFKQNA